MLSSRRIVFAFTISLLFHLSAVTVFRIVVAFPTQNIVYYSCEIVEPIKAAPTPSESTERLRLPMPGELLAEIQAEEATSLSAEGADPWEGLPRIDLPTLEFSQLERVSLREQGLQVRSRYRELAAPEPTDTWARFGREIGQISSVLGQFLDRKPPSPHREAISRPAAGVAAYVEWLSEPHDRRATMVYPIRALWGVAPERFSEPLIFVFTVDAEGQVVEILSPVQDDEGVVSGIEEALIQYRFEPLAGEKRNDQQGSFIISRDGDEL